MKPGGQVKVRVPVTLDVAADVARLPELRRWKAGCNGKGKLLRFVARLFAVLNRRRTAGCAECEGASDFAAKDGITADMCLPFP
jgi:hypothetical protein